MRPEQRAQKIERLKKQSCVFGNPRRLVSDRSAFTSGEFEKYCRSEDISPQLITAGVPQANGQVERMTRTLIPLLTKLSTSRLCDWYKYLNVAQIYLNSTLHKAIGTTPFRVMLGMDPRVRDNPDVRELLESEQIASFNDRDELQAQKNIEKKR